ncbi:MAG: hypothetical protein RSA73_03460 [Anaerovoracaceae bacterium]
MAKELIEELRIKSGKKYVSDLCGKFNDRDVIAALKELEICEYSYFAWKMAIDYITEGECICDSPEEVKEFLANL